jgi:hypothetical protein
MAIPAAGFFLREAFEGVRIPVLGRHKSGLNE